MRARPTPRLLLLSALAAAVAGFAIARPGPFRATITNPVALVRIAAVVALFVVLSRVLGRFVANRWARAALVGVPAALLVAFAVGPYFRDEEVVEKLATSSAELRGDEAAPVATSTTATSPTTTAPTAATATTAAVRTPTTAATVVPPPTTAPPAAPVEVTRGTFRGIDHRASGTASIYRLPDGTAFVRLEDIDIQNGPDYVLYLVPGPDRERPGDGVSLGDLKANKGSQNYAIPAGTDLARYRSVIIWCQSFPTVFAYATLEQ